MGKFHSTFDMGHLTFDVLEAKPPRPQPFEHLIRVRFSCRGLAQRELKRNTRSTRGHKKSTRKGVRKPIFLCLLCSALCFLCSFPCRWANHQTLLGNWPGDLRLG